MEKNYKVYIERKNLNFIYSNYINNYVKKNKLKFPFIFSIDKENLIVTDENLKKINIPEQVIKFIKKQYFNSDEVKKIILKDEATIEIFNFYQF